MEIEFGLGPEIFSKDVHVIDTNSEWLGVSRLQLMENAGRSVAEIVAQRARRGGRVIIYAGSGGNGGGWTDSCPSPSLYGVYC